MTGNMDLNVFIPGNFKEQRYLFPDYQEAVIETIPVHFSTLGQHGGES